MGYQRKEGEEDEKAGVDDRNERIMSRRRRRRRSDYEEG